MATLLLSGAMHAANPFWGAVIGMAAGAIDQSLLGGNKSTHTQGQRMDGLQLQSSTYGGMIPLGTGRFRANGNIIWASDFVEHAKTEKAGKGGGGSSHTSYSYSISLAVGILDGEVEYIPRIWMNNKVYICQESHEGNSYTFVCIDGSNKFNARIYWGSTDQMPDGYIEAKNGGAGTTAAYRGLSYIVFQDLDLNPFSNSIPQMQFDIITKQTVQGYYALKDIVKTLAEKVKIPTDSLSFVGLEDHISGHLLTEQTTFRAVIESLQTPYFFDVLESDAKLKFMSQSSQVPVIIPEDDWGATRQGESSIDKLSIVDGDILELPAQITVTFFDPTKDFQTNTVYSRRMYYYETANDKTISLSLVLSVDSAQKIADELLVQIWTANTSYTGQLTNKWSLLESADMIQTEVNGVSRFIQINKVDYDGGLVKIEGKSFKVPQIIQHVIVDPVLPTPTVLGAIQCYLLDVPVLTDKDGPGFYVAATADNFRSVDFFKSALDDNSSFAYLDTIPNRVISGNANTVLPDGQTLFFDHINTVDVTLLYGTLDSYPESDVLNGKNAALLGDEIIQFTNANLIAENKYRLSGLLRGRKGTDWATSTHQLNESFLILDINTIKDENINLGDINKNLTYRYAHSSNLDDGVNAEFIHTGSGYKPYSVCHIRGNRDYFGNLTITWIRRTRIGGEWRDYSEASLSEVRELYEIDIMIGNNVARTATVTEPTFYYTKDLQMRDFGTLQSAVTVRIYQVSDKVGRGYVREETI